MLSVCVQYKKHEMGDNVEVRRLPGEPPLCYPVSSSSLTFQVRGSENAELVFHTAPSYDSNMFMISLGMKGNTTSEISTFPNIKLKEQMTPSILSQEEWREFWVTWNRGFVRVGRGGDHLPFMEVELKFCALIAYVTTATCSARSQVQWKFTLSPVRPKTIKRKISGGDPVWMPGGGDLPIDAIIGGHENEPLYIIRAAHNGSLAPGKYVRSQRCAFVAWGRYAHMKRDFEVLVGYNHRWVPTYGDVIPAGALPGGYAEYTHETLYIGRVHIDGHLVLGKVQPSYRLCYVPYMGREIERSDYEILVTSVAEDPHGVAITGNRNSSLHGRNVFLGYRPNYHPVNELHLPRLHPGFGICRGPPAPPPGPIYPFAAPQPAVVAGQPVNIIGPANVGAHNAVGGPVVAFGGRPNVEGQYRNFGMQQRNEEVQRNGFANAFAVHATRPANNEVRQANVGMRQPSDAAQQSNDTMRRPNDVAPPCFVMHQPGGVSRQQFNCGVQHPNNGDNTTSTNRQQSNFGMGLPGVSGQPSNVDLPPLVPSLVTQDLNQLIFGIPPGIISITHNVPEGGPIYEPMEPNFNINPPNFVQLQPNRGQRGFEQRQPNIHGHQPNFEQQQPNVSGQQPNFEQQPNVSGHRSIFEQQQSSVSGQQSNFLQQQSNVSGQRFNVEQQQLIFEQHEPIISGQQPNFEQQGPSASGQQPNFEQQRPNASDQQLNTEQQQPIISGQRLNFQELQPNVSGQLPNLEPQHGNFSGQGPNLAQEPNDDNQQPNAGAQ